MKNYSPLLSICIVTYNRSDIINECLNALCPVTKKYNISIFVSDNASSDNTTDVIQKYVKEYNNIHYFKQISNIGFDRNCEFILKQSDTKYRWVIGDQVIIPENTLICVLDDLNLNDYDVYVVNSVIRKEKINDKIYTDKNELLGEIGWHMTYLGCQIYNKKLVDDGYFSRYYNSKFLQTGITFEYFDSHECYVRMNASIKIEIVNSRPANHWSSTIPIEIFCKDWFLFVMSLPVGYTYEVKRKCILDHGIKSNLFNLKHLLVFRMRNIFSLKKLLSYKYFISQTIFYPFLVLFCIDCIPRSLLKLAWCLNRKIKSFYSDLILNNTTPPPPIRFDWKYLVCACIPVKNMEAA
jgi:glycosyltransferase involved in cell wall biosynthesis